MSEPATGALRGCRVIVTRARNQAEELIRLLEAQGATVLLIPVIDIQPPSDYGPLDQALREAASYHWIIFTSTNTVESLAARASELALPPLSELLAPVRLCAIGPATRSALEARGCQVVLMPETFVGESIPRAFAGTPLDDARILLPRAETARDVVPDALRACGAVVNIVEAYRNVPAQEAAEEIAGLISRGSSADWVTFASGSAVSHFLKLGGRPLVEACHVATIGPITSRVAAKHGIEVDAEAEAHTSQGLVDSILRFYEDTAPVSGSSA